MITDFITKKKTKTKQNKKNKNKNQMIQAEILNPTRL